MKATKKIVGAACALVAATALAAGSTFAWFSTNGTVSATGLNVNVKTDNSYLIIADKPANLTKGLDTIELNYTNEWDTTAGADNTGALLLLASAYKDITAVTKPTYGEDGSITTKGSVTTVDNTKENGAETPGTKSVVDATTWYTGKGVHASDSTIEYDEEGNPITTPLTEANFGQYVVTSDFVISVASGSVAINHVYATMSSEQFKTGQDISCPIHVVFLYQTVAPEGDQFGAVPTNSGWTKQDVSIDQGLTNVDLGGITSDKYYIAVKVMVYLDGNETDVNTGNQANLTGVSLDFTFKDSNT